MANINSIRDRLGNTVCRRCIAEKYGVTYENLLQLRSEGEADESGKE